MPSRVGEKRYYWQQNQISRSTSSAASVVNAADPTVLDGIGDAYHLSGLVWRTRHGLLALASTEHCCEVFSPCAAAAVYRRAALLEFGGLDEDYFCNVEEVDLGFRLRLLGYRYPVYRNPWLIL